MKKREFWTNQSIFNEVVKQVENTPAYNAVHLDYHSSPSGLSENVKTDEFEPLLTVQRGGNEGIYLNCYLYFMVAIISIWAALRHWMNQTMELKQCMPWQVKCLLQ